MVVNLQFVRDLNTAQRSDICPYLPTCHNLEYACHLAYATATVQFAMPSVYRT